MGREHWTPLSILVGSAVVAAGLYLGLRERSRDRDPSLDARAIVPSSASPPVPTPGTKTVDDPVVEGSTVPSSVAPVSSAPSDAATDAEVGKAMGVLRGDIQKLCWAPHRGDKGAPKKLQFSYTGVFDAKGSEVGRAISDVREAFFSPVSECVRALPMNLRIAAPGRYINVTQTLEIE